MKSSTRFGCAAILLLALFVIINGCKKKSDDPVVTPIFTVTSSAVLLQSGGEGLQFFAKCTNNDVKMTNVSLTDPTPFITIYDCRGVTFAKNALIPLQNTDEAYAKKTGVWKFKLVGIRASDNASFAVDETMDVSK